jgi:hypothetical protein
MWATEESCETCSVRLDSAWSPRVILAVPGDEDQSLGAQSDRRGRRQHRNRLVYPLVARSHRQHNAKLCVATHHASICFGSLFQRIGFDHGAYPAQFRKAKRVIGIRRRYPCPSFNSLAAQITPYIAADRSISRKYMLENVRNNRITESSSKPARITRERAACARSNRPRSAWP